MDLSYRKRDKLRRKESLETDEQAEKRSRVEQEKIESVAMIMNEIMIGIEKVCQY